MMSSIYTMTAKGVEASDDGSLHERAFGKLYTHALHM
jgi:hypothetical protein